MKCRDLIAIINRFSEEEKKLPLSMDDGSTYIQFRISKIEPTADTVGELLDELKIIDSLHKDDPEIFINDKDILYYEIRPQKHYEVNKKQVPIGCCFSLVTQNGINERIKYARTLLRTEGCLCSMRFESCSICDGSGKSKLL